jgi:hypothetical protein
LVIYIDKLNIKSGIGNQEVREKSAEQSSLPNVHPSRLLSIENPNPDYSASEQESISTTETNIHNEVINNCKAFLEQ